MMLMQLTDYKLLYLVIINAKYLYKYIYKFGKTIKIKTVDQIAVELFNPVRNDNLNSPIQSEKFSN